ncbi:MAG: multicopper oxidase family protein [bacterium]
MINRRNFLKRSAQLGVLAASAKFSNADASVRNAPEAMQELRIPPVITGGELTLAKASAQLYPGINTDMYLVNNSFPAPTIRVKKGDTFTANIHNNLGENSILHWHGIHAPSEMGGHPKYAIDSGNSYSVNFPIKQRAGASFYHAHPNMNMATGVGTGKQVYMGIAGLFIVEDDEEKALGLPSGEFEIPLMITDKRFDANSQLIYDPSTVDINSGWLGDTILINGTPNAFVNVAPTLYRFRVVNASNSRFYKLALADGKTFTVIGNDGGFMEKPIQMSAAWLAPAERLDILIDFSSYTVGQSVILQSLKFTFSDGPGSGTVAQGAAMNLLLFQVTKSVVTNGTVPTALPAIEKYNVADAKRTRTWIFAATHHVNEHNYSLDLIDANVPIQDLERWEFVSEAQNTHPIHVHGSYFQVLNRNGAPPDPTEGGWKDVVRLDPQGTVNVLVKFTEYTGLFLIHCHKLEHADGGMMANFIVDAIGSVPQPKIAQGNLHITPNPATSYAMLSFPALTNDERISIVDLKGAMLVDELIERGSTQYAVSTAEMAVGHYHISLGQERATLVVLR